MPSFGSASRAKLRLLDDRLVCVLEQAIKLTDFTILVTHRGEVEQNRMVAEGKSKLSFPNSKHNSNPAKAVDVAPWPIDWEPDEPGDKALERFAHLAGIIRGVALQMNIPIRWGGDWDRDGELSDNRFDDLPHIEIDTQEGQ